MSITALTIAVAVLAAVAIIFAIALALIHREQRRTRILDPTARAVADALRAGQDQQAITELLGFLEAIGTRVQALSDHARALDETLARLTERSQAYMQRIGVVRFDASDSVSGRLSCALAILDGYHHGFLITTLYDLERSRTFVRAIKFGRADRELLEEEREALEMAMRGGLAAETPAPVEGTPGA